MSLCLLSCEKVYINGDLDGMWKLQTVETTDTTIRPQNIYYSFQRHLVMLGEHFDTGFPNYYLAQFDQIKGMGNLEQLMGMMPGVKPGALKDAKIDEKQLARTEAIIKSMTVQEREDPDIISSSRKKRIAAGSGTSVEEVNKLLKAFEQMRKMIRQFSSPGMAKKMKRMKGFGGGFPGFPGM